ncbi:MAG: phage capsid protein [Verrucomicrobia bacterium]|nr:phage capsid protein [Verrucomicrobiota bacterium]
MSDSISTAFIKQYEGDVHVAYQRQGAKMRNSCRVSTGVVGSTDTFQVVGKGLAATKTRHGKVPVMNLVHTNVEATLSDYYAGEWCDKLDSLKHNHDERKIAAQSGAYACGRKVDDLINTAVRASLGSGQKVAVGTTGLTKAKILAAMEIMGDGDVPDDGERYFFVGVHQWMELLNLSEFSNADYVGDRKPWLGGTDARVWMNATWVMHTGLDVTSGTRFCLGWHKSAVGWSEGQDIKADITWQGDYAAHFINHNFSGGSVRIDDLGVVEIACDDDAAIS